MHVSTPKRAEPSVRQRVRIRFSKQGDLRFIGHRDLVRVMERLFRRAELPLGMSQGFHPKPRMSFPIALAVGIEGLDEFMEIELAQPAAAEPLLRQLAAHGVPGLDFHHVEVLPLGAKGNQAKVARVTYQIAVPAEREDKTAQNIARLTAAHEWPLQRPNRREPIDLLKFLEELTLSEGTLLMTFRVTQEANPGPRDVLDTLELADLERQGAYLRRTKVDVQI